MAIEVDETALEENEELADFMVRMVAKLVGSDPIDHAALLTAALGRSLAETDVTMAEVVLNLEKFRAITLEERSRASS